MRKKSFSPSISAPVLYAILAVFVVCFREYFLLSGLIRFGSISNNSFKEFVDVSEAVAQRCSVKKVV